jgi:hypothetical protein
LRTQSEDLASIRLKAKTRSDEILDRNLAELTLDIGFLEGQIEADLELPPAALQRTQKKLAFLREKAEIVRLELDDRKKA